MADLSQVTGLPLDEGLARLGHQRSRVTLKPSGQTGSARVSRWCNRDGLVTGERRILRVRRTGEDIELVVAPTYERPQP